MLFLDEVYVSDEMPSYNLTDSNDGGRFTLSPDFSSIGEQLHRGGL